VAVIRPFNTYGPRQSARAVIPTIITQIATGKRNIRLGVLHPTRDFNYVTDTVDGFVAIAQSSQSVGEVINVGSNYEISIGDTARLIANVMGVDVEFTQERTRLRPEKSEVERLWADNAKAKKLTGWEPSYGGLAGLKRGLEETVAWFTRPENLANYKTDIYNI
jgi:nucleoside-diphosphate-sugar epimerase